jgi:hypothetical protein
MPNSGIVYDQYLIQNPKDANASIAGIPFRLNPDSVSLSFSAKTSQTPTIGGLVVQVFGIEYSDLVVTGSFGKGSYAEQTSFLNAMHTIAVDQSTQNTERTITSPVRFLFPLMEYDFQVYIKEIASPQGQAFVFDNTLFALQYTLTLFIETDNSTRASVSPDKYLARLATGLGYKLNEYNGPTTTQAAQYVAAAGGLAALSLQLYGQTPAASTTSTTSSDPSATGSTGATNLTGNGNVLQIWNYLIGVGLSAYAAAGVMGNWQTESGFNPDALQPGTTAPAGYKMDGQHGFGLAQWTDAGRQDNLAAWAVAHGNKPISDMLTQLNFFWHELNSSYGSTLTAIQNASSAAAAAAAFYPYEGYAGSLQSARSDQATTIYNTYSNSSTSGKGANS